MAETDTTKAKKAPAAKKEAAATKAAPAKAPTAKAASTKTPATKAAPAAKPAKAAKMTVAAKSAYTGPTVTVTQTGGTAGRPEWAEQTLIGLGLNKRHRTRVLQDTPSIRGMIERVKHLVRVGK
jgi:large subunit ribosomal protein L30